MAKTDTYKRATEYAKGIGESLDKIADKDVLLLTYERKERSMRGEPKTFVAMTIATVDDPTNGVSFHAWSESLADKLDEIPPDAFPVLVKFTKVSTAGGFKVWSIE